MNKNFIKDNKYILIFNLSLLIFTLLMMWVKPADVLKDYVIERLNPDEITMVPIYNDVTLEQYFNIPVNADAIEVRISAANDSFQGRYRLDIFDEENNHIKGWINNKLDLASSDWIEFNFDSLPVGNNYRIIISAEELNNDNAILVYIANQKPDGFDELKINTSNVNSSLCMGVYKRLTNYFAIAAVIVVFLTANIWWVLRKYGIDRYSIPLLIGTGLVMFFIMAPGSGPDEVYHYYSAFELSNAILGRENLSEVEFKYKDALPLHINSNYAFVKTIKDLSTEYEDNGEVFIYDGVKDKLIQPLSHMAPAIGVTIGRILGLNFIKVYELGRVFNLFVYIFLAWLAIRIVPINKELMLFFSVLPMQMHQACQMSYDPIVNGFMMIYVAYVFKIIHEGSCFKTKQVSICFILLGLISPVKVIYSILVILLFAIHDNQFASKFDKYKKILIISFGTFITLFISKWSDIYNVFWGNDYRVPVDSYTPTFLVQNPLYFFKVIINSIDNSLLVYMKEVAGFSLSGYTVKVPEYLPFIIWCLFILCAISSNKSIFKMEKQKIIVIITSLLGFFIVFVTFFFEYTPYGYKYIQGVQGRYFSPFIIPFMYCLNNEKMNIIIHKDNIYIIMWFVELSYIVSVMNQIYI